MHHTLVSLRALTQAGAALVVVGGLASAQLAGTGPFTGSDSESFETQDLSGGPFPPCVVDRVFNDQADLCSAAGGAHITTGWGFGCTILPQDASRLFASTSGAAIYTFDTGATRFGGYFGTNNPSVSDGVIQFYDAAGTLLYSDVIVAPNNCTWSWGGWDFGSDVVKSIHVVGNYSSGGYIMMDGMQADLLPGSVGTPYCFGDGTGTPCPCGNSGGTGEGCANSTGGGATLSASGLPSVAGAASFALHSEGATPGTPGLFFEGVNQIAGGAIFGDGLRCVGGAVSRLQVTPSNGSGEASSSVNIPALSGAASGDTRYYQFWYRDPNGSPCGAQFNLTNGLAITWQP